MLAKEYFGVKKQGEEDEEEDEEGEGEEAEGEEEEEGEEGERGWRWGDRVKLWGFRSRKNNTHRPSFMLNNDSFVGEMFVYS